MTKKKFEHPDLNQKRSHAKAGPIATDAQARKMGQAQSDDEWQSILMLCDEYGIKNDDNFWMNLAIALAMDFVPAFQEKTRPGKKVKWTDHRRGVLVVEIERIKESRSCSVEIAAAELAKKEPWKEFLQIKEKGQLTETSPDPGEALRKTYYQSRNHLWSKIVKEAYLYHELLGTTVEWESTVTDAFTD